MTLSSSPSGAPQPAPRNQGRAFPGALLMLFPLLTLALGIAYLQGRRPAPAAPPRAPDPRLARAVEAWVGETQLAQGAHVSARLTRLHSDPLRQDFDARTLGTRFELGPGEPWQLELLLEGGAERGLALAGLVVCDEVGVRLGPFALASASPTAVADPVAVLLRGPSELRPGEVVDVPLWGQEPGPGCEIRGLEARVSLYRSAFEVRAPGSSLASLRQRAGPVPVEDGSSLEPPSSVESPRPQEPAADGE